MDIIAYLKTAPNKFVSLLEISRRAGGRRRFEEAPNWARNLMAPLMEAGLIEVNSRGHYRHMSGATVEPKPKTPVLAAKPQRKIKAKVVGDDYFPSSEGPRIVGGDYFPAGCED